MKKASNSNWFNRSLVVLAWFIVTGGAVGLIYYLFFTNKYVSTNDAQVEQYITPVASKVAGFVQEVRFHENQAVKKGDTLVIIDNREYINSLSMAQADLQSTELNAIVNQKAISTSKGAIQQKRAALQNASLYVPFTIVTAPYDGWVGKLTIQPGQLVKEGQTLVNVVSLEKWVSANFRETQIAPLVVGNKVVIKADAYPGQKFTGVVESFSPASGSKFSLVPQDNSTGNLVKIEQRIPTRIKFDNHAGLDKLRAGMNVTISAEKTTINHSKR